jgi:prepilin signal peptidase PulO-like enzyme (type II secretory pathway)
VALFANSFIIGTIILLPGFLRDIIVHRKTIIKELFSPAKLQALINGVGCAVCYSWIFFPFFYVLNLSSPIIISSFIFFIISSRYKIKKEEENKQFFKNLIKNVYLEAIGGFLIGYLSRLILAPNSLSFSALKQYFTLVTLSSMASLIIYSIFNHFKDYKERIPFAPLLFIGCLLSYTPFSTWITHLGHR